jgi:hypothetical protein
MSSFILLLEDPLIRPWCTSVGSGEISQSGGGLVAADEGPF